MIGSYPEKFEPLGCIFTLQQIQIKTLIIGILVNSYRLHVREYFPLLVTSSVLIGNLQPFSQSVTAFAFGIGIRRRHFYYFSAMAGNQITISVFLHYYELLPRGAIIIVLPDNHAVIRRIVLWIVLYTHDLAASVIPYDVNTAAGRYFFNLPELRMFISFIIILYHIGLVFCRIIVHISI